MAVTAPERPTVTLDAQTEFWWLLTGYVRYAMGRRSTAPFTALELVIAHRRSLLPSQAVQLAEEVESGLRTETVREGYLGDACDVQTWKAVADELRKLS